jgi:hypothetical protein
MGIAQANALTAGGNNFPTEQRSCSSRACCSSKCLRRPLQLRAQLVAPTLVRPRLRPLPLSACPPLAAGPPVLAAAPGSMPLRLALLPALRGPPRPFLASGWAAACSVDKRTTHMWHLRNAGKGEQQAMTWHRNGTLCLWDGSSLETTSAYASTATDALPYVLRPSW